MLLVSTNLIGQETVPQSFKHLQAFKFQHQFGFDFNPVVFFNTNFSKVINKQVDKSHILYEEWVDEIGLLEMVVTKLNNSTEDLYHVFFDFGPSMDPNFSFYIKQGDSLKYQFSKPGLRLFIPGNGNIYIDGHTNNYFNERKKYKIENKKLVEIKQPYLYVGIKTKNKKILKLYRAKEQQNLVATLPPESEIEVLINEGHNYLIKTSFGLVGWWKFDGYRSDTIEEIFFYGD